MKQKYVATGFIFLICLGFFYLNQLIPFMSDDFVFGYRFFGPDVYSNQPIASVDDFIESLKQIYITHNGRLLAHGLMLTFCALLGKSVFNIVNAIVFGYAVYLTWKLIIQTTDRKWQSTWLLLPVVAFYLAIAPAPGDTLLWVSGALNYLWTTTICLLILYLFERRQQYATASSILFGLLGLIGGQSHELLSISFSAAFLWCWIREPKSITTPFQMLIVAFWFSSLSVVFAPGIMTRAFHSGLAESTLWSEVGQRIALFGALSIRSVIIPILFGWMPFFFVLRGKDMFVDYVRKNQFLWIVLLINLCFLFVMKTPFFRAYYMPAVIAFLLFARSFTQSGLFTKARHNIIITCCLLPFLFIYGGQVINTCLEIDRYYTNLEEQIKQSGDKAIIPVDNFETKGHFIPSAFIIDKSRYHFTNRYMSYHYGKEAIQFIPKPLYNTLEACAQDSSFIRTAPFELLEREGIYLIAVDGEHIAEEYDRVSYYKQEPSAEYQQQLPVHKRLFHSLMGMNSMEEENYFTIDIQQTNFMVFAKREGIKKIRVPFQLKGTLYFRDYPIAD